MKSFLLWFAGASLVCGQAPVEVFGEDAELPSIGIVPVQVLENAKAKIQRLEAELERVRREGAVPQGAPAVEGCGQLLPVMGDRAQARIAELEAELAGLRKDFAAQLKQERDGFAKREQGMVERIDAMEKQRGEATNGFQKQMAGAQAEFGRKQGDFEKQIVKVEQKQAEAARLLEVSEKIRVENEEAWGQSVAAYQKEAAAAMRSAQVRDAQEAVANTARLAEDWQLEREGLKQTQAENNAAWEKSVDDYRTKAEAAMRTSQMKSAQDAVANTARLAESWQGEREELEMQVNTLTKQLAKLGGAMGVKSFEQNQTEILRQSLATKSKTLSSLGNQAAKLAGDWRQEREQSEREIAKLEAMVAATGAEAQSRDERIAVLKKTLAERNETLTMLTTEAEKLSESWTNQRGGLQRKIKALEDQLQNCQQQLEQALAKEKSAAEEQEKLEVERLGLLSETQEIQEEEKKANSELAEQVAIAEGLVQQLNLVKQKEGKLKQDLEALKSQQSGLAEEVARYKQEKEADQKIIAELREELKTVRGQYAAAERDLAASDEKLKIAQEQVIELKEKGQKTAAELEQARVELAQARKETELGDQEADEAALVEKEKQVTALEEQLGRLMTAQQELEGTLIATLGDFESLQTDYATLQSKAANGGEASKAALEKQKELEANLLQIRGQLSEKDAELEDARKRIKEAEAAKNAVEDAAKAAKQAANADDQAGKAALGKLEAELQAARSELGQLQLGQQALVIEAKELRQQVVTIAPVRYQLASADVAVQQQRVLAEVREVLAVYPEAKFEITGHTCNLGSKEGNLKLSQERAEGLRDFLLENEVSDGSFAEIKGLADEQPEASNESDEGRQKNRRVEIKVER